MATPQEWHVMCIVNQLQCVFCIKGHCVSVTCLRCIQVLYNSVLGAVVSPMQWFSNGWSEPHSHTETYNNQNLDQCSIRPIRNSHTKYTFITSVSSSGLWTGGPATPTHRLSTTRYKSCAAIKAGHNSMQEIAIFDPQHDTRKYHSSLLLRWMQVTPPPTPTRGHVASHHNTIISEGEPAFMHQLTNNQ